MSVCMEILIFFLLSKIDHPIRYVKLTFKVNNSIVVYILDRSIVRQADCAIIFLIASPCLYLLQQILLHLGKLYLRNYALFF